MNIPVLSQLLLEQDPTCLPLHWWRRRDFYHYSKISFSIPIPKWPDSSTLDKSEMSDSPIPIESDSINTVSVKLPPFWPDQPLVWFAQAELQFALRNIVLTTIKYYHVTAVLPQVVALSVLDILREPPTVEPYETPKKRLVQSFDLTDYQRAEQFAKLPSLVDRCPSELMDTMLSLLPSNHSPCYFFKYNFL